MFSQIRFKYRKTAKGHTGAQIMAGQLMILVILCVLSVI